MYLCTVNRKKIFIPLSLFGKKLAIVFVNSKNPSIMKHLAQIAIVVAAVLLAAACNNEPPPIPTPENTVRHVAYTVCGEPGSATTTGTDEWHALLDSLLTSAEGGCAVTFWDADLTAAQPTKETVTYSTASRDSAFAWGERMYDQGYTVSVIRDPITGMYNCSATRLIPGQDNVIRNIYYVNCDHVDAVSVIGDAEWQSLLDSLLDASGEGCPTILWSPDTGTILPQAVSSYRTFDRDSVITWSERMFDYGLTVSVLFDQTEQIYNCSAVNTVAQAHSPLATHISGVIDEEELLIINSQAQYDSLFPNCPLQTQVDFESQSLLAAYGIIPSTIFATVASVTRNGNDIAVTLSVIWGDGAHPERWATAFVCSPKIVNEQNISLIINHIN